MNNYSKKNIPYVSVLMSVHNSENTVNFAIDSILNQTFSNFELLIMNDCSTDKTQIILEKYQNVDSRIKLFNNSTNLGLRSLNTLIENSNGSFIARQDADDFSLPLRLKSKLNTLKNIKLMGVLLKLFKKFD